MSTPHPPNRNVQAPAPPPPPTHQKSPDRATADYGATPAPSPSPRPRRTHLGPAVATGWPTRRSRRRRTHPLAWRRLPVGRPASPGRKTPSASAHVPSLHLVPSRPIHRALGRPLSTKLSQPRAAPILLSSDPTSESASASCTTRSAAPPPKPRSFSSSRDGPAATTQPQLPIPDRPRLIPERPRRPLHLATTATVPTTPTAPATHSPTTHQALSTPEPRT